MKNLFIILICLLASHIGCSEVTESGNLVDANSDIYTGDLVIEPQTWTEGLYSNLKRIEGDLQIVGFTPVATGTVILASLTEITGSLEISDNISMTEIGLPALTAIGGTITILQNSIQTINLSALLTSEAILIDQYSSVSPALKFDLLNAINGDLNIKNNSITSINFFPALKTISGSLIINNNNSLASISFPMLTAVQGPEFSITNNSSLSIAAADAVKTGVTIADPSPDTTTGNTGK